MISARRRRFLPLGTLFAVVLAVALSVGAPLAAQAPRNLFDRAVADFEAGRVVESAEGFDAVIDASPSVAPQLWQRGIALYYADRYDDCRAQFELHRTVNPADVENAAWHFLCVAREESASAARAALLPVGPDPRAPMREVYDMFRGTLTPEQVLAAAGSQVSAQFYAQLYVGLYFEALGQDAQALEHITAAADDRFARVGGYMHIVAKVHLEILRRR
jgi:lipoprotein NlpI